MKAPEPDDRLVQIAQSPEGVYALTASGRLFLRTRDPKGFAGPHGDARLIWQEIAGPLASVEDQIKKAAAAAAAKAEQAMREQLGAA